MTVPVPDVRAALAPRRVLAAVLVALVCGGFVAAQSRLNGGLSVAGAGVLVASLLSYVGTLATSVLVIVLMGRARATATLLRRESRWWWYAIGLFGIPIVLTMAAGVPILGVAIASVCSIVLPGCNVMVTCVCASSDAGRKPELSSGIVDSERPRNRQTPSNVSMRCRKQVLARAM